MTVNTYFWTSNGNRPTKTTSIKAASTTRYSNTVSTIFSSINNSPISSTCSKIFTNTVKAKELMFSILFLWPSLSVCQTLISNRISSTFSKYSNTICPNRWSYLEERRLCRLRKESTPTSSSYRPNKRILTNFLSRPNFYNKNPNIYGYSNRHPTIVGTVSMCLIVYKAFKAWWIYTWTVKTHLAKTYKTTKLYPLRKSPPVI